MADNRDVDITDSIESRLLDQIAKQESRNDSLRLQVRELRQEQARNRVLITNFRSSALNGWECARLLAIEFDRRATERRADKELRALVTIDGPNAPPTEEADRG